MKKINIGYGDRLYLIILRGLPGIGKSTWLKEHDLEYMTLSPDDFRLKLKSPCYILKTDENNNHIYRLSIDQTVSSKAWRLVDDILEYRLEHQCSTIIDATFMNTDVIDKYAKIANSYDAKFIILDFGNDKDLAFERNDKRIGSFRYVPRGVIFRMYQSGLKQDLKKDLDKYTVYKPDEVNIVFE